VAEDRGHILRSYALPGGAVVPPEAIGAELAADAPNWVHLDRNHPQTRPWLEANAPFLDPETIDALLDEETRPRLLLAGDGAIVILRAVNHNPGAEPEDMVSFRLWIDRRRVISLGGRPIRALDDLVRALTGPGRPQQAGAFLARLIEALVDPLQPVLDELEATIDEAEEKIGKNPSRETGLLSDLRRTALLLRRHIAPERDVIGQLLASPLPWLTAGDRRHLQETQANLLRHVEDLDLAADRIHAARDELQGIFAAKLARNTLFFSVLAAVFLPVSFVTGLFGANVGGVPGGANPAGFWMLAGILALVMILEILIFRWMRWF
jgi:zinc transporter